MLKPVLTLVVGDKFTVPVTGEIKTLYSDKSDRSIGKGTHQITEKNEVVVGKEWLDIKTNLQETTVVIDIPELPRKLNRIGLNIVTNFSQISLGRIRSARWQLNWIDGLFYGRVEKNYNTKVKSWNRNFLLNKSVILNITDYKSAI